MYDARIKTYDGPKCEELMLTMVFIVLLLATKLHIEDNAVWINLFAA
jgi:hypothetical protein